jgi:Ca2+-binding RTX toxin-like protein
MFYNPPGFTLGSRFGATRNVDGGKPHGGVDLRAPAGTLVPAALDGTVFRVGVINGYGITVIIRDASGNFELYAHLSAVGLPAVGATIHAGDPVGRVGTLQEVLSNKGIADGPHLHFEVISGAAPLSASGGLGIWSSDHTYRADPTLYDPDHPSFPYINGGGVPPLPTTNRAAISSQNADVQALGRVDLNDSSWQFALEDDGKLIYYNAATGQQVAVRIEDQPSSQGVMRVTYELYDQSGTFQGKRVVSGNLDDASHVFKPISDEFYDHNGKLVAVKKQSSVNFDSQIEYSAVDPSGHSIAVLHKDGVDKLTLDGVQIHLKSAGAEFQVNQNGTATINGIEHISFSSGGHSLSMQNPTGSAVGVHVGVDLGATLYSSNATLDFTQYVGSVYLGTYKLPDNTGEDVGVFSDDQMASFSGYDFARFNTLNLGAGDDKVDVSEAANPYLHLINTGGGKNTIKSGNVNVTVNLQGSDDTVLHAGQGSVINVGSGHATIYASDDVLINNLKPTDTIYVNGKIVHGAIGAINSESRWINSSDGVSYGLNSQGELGIRDALGNIMYITGYHGGPTVPFAQQTAGIFVGLGSIEIQRFKNISMPASENIPTTFKLGQELYYVQTGKLFFPPGNDPLVFDLTGGGINLTAVSAAAPMFDANHTGFAVHTGWFQNSNGILVVDKNGNGQIDDISEIVGGKSGGFAELAVADTNHDGVIDSEDSISADLRIWRDANGDALVNAGELMTLTQAGIASITVASTAQTGVSIAGNAVLASGSFTRTDGTSGTVDQVLFAIDALHSVYKGSTSISPVAAVLPNLKGFGTLADLRVAMTIDPALATAGQTGAPPTLIDVINANLPNLNQIDLNALRAAALPILNAWALAVPLLDTNGNPQVVQPSAGHSDLPIYVLTDSNGQTTVADFAYLFTDAEGSSYFKLASGVAVKDAQGQVIEHPTVADVMAQPGWTELTAGEIGFMERYLGTPLPIDVTPEHPTALLAAMQSFVTGAWSAMNLQAVRLAMQGPLASYFAGVSYDAAANTFHATTDQQLSPMYEQIFGHAPTGPSGVTAWLASWRPIVDVVLGDLDRGGLTVSYAFTFASMVHAYETVGLPISMTEAAEALGVPSGLIIQGGSVVNGTDKADIFYLSGGDQIAMGGAGADNYVVGGSFGHLTIDDTDTGGAGLIGDNPDLLRLTSLRSTDVTATRDGIDLILHVNGDPSRDIRILGEFTGVRPGLSGGNMNPDRGVAEIVFADGVVWDKRDIAAAASHPRPDLAVVAATADNDVLDGGVGGDTTLIGGDGGDTYLFGRGYGHDTIDDQQGWILQDAPDVVKFESGITRSDLEFSRVGNSLDLHIAIKGTTDVLTVNNQFDVAYNVLDFETNRIEIFGFSDGSYLSWEDVIRYMNVAARTDGNDIIHGFSYTDNLDGGAGNDYLSGHNESDTYIFGRGYGHDTVHDDMGNILASDTDVVVLKDIAYSDVTFQRVGNSEDFSILVNGTDDVLTIQGQFRILYGLINVVTDRIEQFKFSDGTILSWEDIIHNFNATAGTDGNDAIYGFNYWDTLEGGLGDDLLQGGREDDTYIYTRGDGNDTIIEVADAQTSAFDTLVLHGIAPSSVSLVRDGNDFILVIAESAPGAGDGGSVRLKDEGNDFFAIGVERVTFDDGTTWSQNDLRLRVIAQVSTPGNDTITGFNTIDTFRGGAGDDTITGEGGSDVYIYARGDGHDVVIDNGGDGGDTLILEGLNPSDVTLVRLGNDLKLVIAESTPGAGNGGSVLLKEELDAWFGRGIENIQFADGTVWHQNDLRLMTLAQASTAGNDTIVGFNVADTLRGGLGNDSIYGGAESDTYIYARGDGNDVITEGAGSGVDTLVLEGLNSSVATVSRIGEDVLVTIAESAPGAGDGGSILLKNSLNDWFGQGVEQIQFADGTIWTKAQIRAMLISSAGTPGNDVINGSSSSDIIAGGLGNDTINGGGGADIYIYNRGDGNDILADDATDNVVDTLTLNGIGRSQVSLVRNGNNLTLVIAESAAGAGDGGSILLKEQLDWFYQRGIEQITFADGTVWSADDLRVMLIAQASTSGNDTIIGFNTADVLQGGAGNDTLNGFNGDDTYIYTRGDGNDVITEPNGNSDKLVLHGIAPGNVSLVRDGNHVTLVIAESAPGAGDGGSIRLPDALEWNYDRGIEQILFDNGTIWTPTDLRVMALAQASTSGNDTIVGFNTADVIQGGAGNDTINGWSGDDIYIYTRGDGNDVITEPNGNLDKLILHGIAPGNVSLVRDGNHVTLVIAESAPGAGDGGSVQLRDALEWNYDRGIEQIVFDNGTIWTPTDLRLMVLAQASTSGNDTIIGFNTADVLQGGAGNDTLTGAGGDDAYIYTRGDGVDVISDQGGSNANSLVLHGITPSELTIVRNADSAILLIGAGGVDGRITIRGQFNGAGPMASIKFDDTTVWNGQTILALAIANDGSVLTHAGTSGADTIIGTSDIDVIDGGAGNDTLRGEGGSDFYRWGAGSGNDTILENGGVSDTDIVRLNGINPADVSLSRFGNDLFITLTATGEVLKVQGHFGSTNAGIEQIKFADNTTWDRAQIAAAAWFIGTSAGETIDGGAIDDTIDGRGGNDILIGHAGNDSYLYGGGSGNDTVVEGAAASDGSGDSVKLLGLNLADIQIGRSGNDLILKILSSNESVRIQNQFSGDNGIETIAFGDGSILTRGQFQAMAAIFGTSGNDNIYGSSGADTIDGGAGNDYMEGGGGGDTYIYAAGYGNDSISEGSSDGTDVVKLLGLNPSDVTFIHYNNSDHLQIAINSTGEVLSVSNQFNGTNGVEQVSFADGTIWDRSQIQAAAWYRGTAANENIYGSASADIFDGKGGNDYLEGRGGGDTYLYGVGSSNDSIAEGATDGTIDVVKLIGLNASDVTLMRANNSDHLQIQINLTGEFLTVSNQFNATNGIEQILFADGSTLDRSQIQAAAWYRGTAAGENIYGSGSADTIDSKGGNDYQEGRGGGDTYIYAAGYGNDSISEGAVDGTDVVKLTALNASDVTLIHANNSDHLQIQINATGEFLTVSNQFNATNGIEQILFADGSTLDRSQIQAAAWYRGTSSGENIYGSASADTIDSKGGNDYQEGRGGGDTYIYAVGYGNDSISEGVVDGTDVVKLNGLNSSDVTFGRSGNNLQIRIISTGETLTVQDQFNGTNGVEQVVFADSTAWNRDQILSASWIRGTSGNDTLSGTSSNDIFLGDMGNDTFNSGAGSDTYVYALGDGNDYINDESGSTTDVDTLRLVDLSASDLTFSRVGVHLVATVNSNGQTITFDEQFYSQTANWGLEKIEFANGNSWDLATINANAWIRGTSGNDTITGSSWNDTFKGGLGNDTFSSGPGSDTYVYALGDGNDYVNDESGSTIDVDTLRLTDLNASDLTFSRVGVNLVATVNSNGQTITFDEQFYSQTQNWGLEKIEFADGTSWDLATINANAAIRGSSGNDTIGGTAWNDTIAGGAGNDTMSGGAGSDTFLFRTNLGQDTVTDFTAGTDALEFRDGIFADAAAALAAASSSGSDTLITIDANNTVLLKNVSLASLHETDFHIV